MKTFYKLVATVSVIPVIGIVFLSGSIILNEGKNFFAPFVDTEFSRDYSPQKFDLITDELKLDSVVSIIGMPLCEIRDTINGQIEITYVYTNDGSFKSKIKDKDLMIEDFAWYRSTITFDVHGNIVNINKGWSYD